MYEASVNRQSSGMNVTRETLPQILERISEYEKSFPGQIISVTITKTA